MGVNSYSSRNNPVLTEIVQGFTSEGFIADKILPKRTVRAMVGAINSKGAQHLRIHDTDMSRNSVTPLLKTSMDKTDVWNIESHGLRIGISEDDAAKHFPGNPEAGRRELREMGAIDCKTAIEIARENALLTALTTTSNYTASNTVTLSGTDQFNDFINSNPDSVFLTARKTIRANVFQIPNVAFMRWDVFETLSTHPQMIGKMATDTFRGDFLTLEQMAKIMRVRTLLISEATKNTAAEGLTPVMAEIMDKSIVFAYVDPAPARTRPAKSLGYCFEYEPVTADNYRENEPKDTEFVRVTHKRDDVILTYSAAYLIKNAIA